MYTKAWPSGVEASRVSVFFLLPNPVKIDKESTAFLWRVKYVQWPEVTKDKVLPMKQVESPQVRSSRMALTSGRGERWGGTKKR